MSGPISIEHGLFEADIVQYAAEEAQMIINTPSPMLRLAYNYTNTVTDSDSGSGFVNLQPAVPGAYNTLRVEAPNLWKISTTLQTHPYRDFPIRINNEPTLTINHTQPFSEVSKHKDGGSNERNWLGRVATIAGDGEFIVYGQDDEIIQKTIVTPGDATTHLNPANLNLRPEHKVKNLSDDTRISLGMLVALKTGILGRKKAAQIKQLID